MAEFQIVRDEPGNPDVDGVVLATCTVPDDPNIPGPVVCRTTGAPGTDETYGTVREVAEHVTAITQGVGLGFRLEPPDFFDRREAAASDDADPVDASDVVMPPADTDAAGS